MKHRWAPVIAAALVTAVLMVCQLLAQVWRLPGSHTWGYGWKASLVAFWLVALAEEFLNR